MEPAYGQVTGNALSTEKHPGTGVVLYSGTGIIPERVGVAKKIKMRNSEILAIGNIFYSVERVLFPRTVRRNRTISNQVVGNSAVLLVKFLRCVRSFFL